MKKFAINDMVLLKDTNLSPMKWLLGRIVHLYPSRDDVTRIVKVRTINGIKDRHVKYLCLLPFEGDSPSGGGSVFASEVKKV